MTKWYGSINNRMEEGKQFVDEIKVGTGITEYHWSDRTPYEVVAVKDQKHITIREMGRKHVGEAYTNNWELFSDESNPLHDLEKRGDVWYYTVTITKDELEKADEMNEMDAMDWKLRLCLAGFDLDKIMEKGKQTKRRKANISIGRMEYYYDYSF